MGLLWSTLFNNWKYKASSSSYTDSRGSVLRVLYVRRRRGGKEHLTRWIDVIRSPSHARRRPSRQSHQPFSPPPLWMRKKLSMYSSMRSSAPAKEAVTQSTYFHPWLWIYVYKIEITIKEPYSLFPLARAAAISRREYWVFSSAHRER